MIDKQIIIDGVDVSGCKFCDWKGSDIPQCRIRQASFEPTCKGYNCYYKQLKHKEQECEELNKTIIYKCPQCGDEYLSPIGASLYEENNKFKQTLIDIKEIAERDFNHTCWETYAKQLKQILQKIS